MSNNKPTQDQNLYRKLEKEEPLIFEFHESPRGIASSSRVSPSGGSRGAKRPISESRLDYEDDVGSPYSSDVGSLVDPTSPQYFTIEETEGTVPRI
jgi:hypothetical protein